MRQGAIDLVQMELQWRDPRQAAARLRRYRQFYHPPRRLPASAAAAATPPELKAAPASDLVDSVEGGGAGAEGGGQLTSLLSAAAPSSEHVGRAPHACVAAAGERAAAAGSEPSAGCESSQCQAAEPVLELAALTGHKLDAQDAQRPCLAEMRRALRAYRKQPGDGLLHAPLRTGVKLIAEGAKKHVCNSICCVVCTLMGKRFACFVFWLFCSQQDMQGLLSPHHSPSLRGRAPMERCQQVGRWPADSRPGICSSL